MNRFEKPRSSANVVLAIVGAVVGVLVLLVLVCGGLTFLFIYKTGQAMAPQFQAQAELQAADSVVQVFLNQLALGRTDDAYNSTTAAFRARQTLPQFKTFITQNPLLTKFIDVQQAPMNNAPGAARLSIHYTLTGNGIMNLTFQLVKEGGQWKIDSLTVP